MVKSYWASEHDTSINIKYSIINKGESNGRKAIWEVTRVASEGLTFWPKGENTPWSPDNMFMADKAVGAGDLYWMDYEANWGTEKKVLSNPGEGWMAHVNDSRQLFIKTFENVPLSNYTTIDDQVEYYVAFEHLFLELENQSKYVDLAPGDTLNYQVKWLLRNLPDDVDLAVGSNTLVDFTRYWTNSETEGGEVNYVYTDVQKRAALEVKVYPNPTTQMLYFSVSNHKQFNVNVFDVAGVLVASKQVYANSPINVSNLNAGVYLYSIELNEHKINGRFIKE